MNIVLCLILYFLHYVRGRSGHWNQARTCCSHYSRCCNDLQNKESVCCSLCHNRSHNDLKHQSNIYLDCCRENDYYFIVGRLRKTRFDFFCSFCYEKCFSRRSTGASPLSATLVPGLLPLTSAVATVRALSFIASLKLWVTWNDRAKKSASFVVFGAFSIS